MQIQFKLIQNIILNITSLPLKLIEIKAAPLGRGVTYCPQNTNLSKFDQKLGPQ